MNPTTVHQMTARISQLMAERLGAKGRTLDERLASRTRALPRRVRKAVALLAQAEAMAASPKLLKQSDMGAISAAYDIALRYLQPLDSGARVGRLVLGALASLALGLLALGAMLLLVQSLRGAL